MRLLTAGKTDDEQFRRARSIAAVKAVAKAYGWDTRSSPKPRGAGPILAGRGIAYAFRNQTVIAQIAEVEVNRRTGHVWVKRLVCAHDCGLVINPEGLRRTIEGNMLFGLSRTLHEEVRFDTEKVTSVDWSSHPTLTHADTPARIDIVLAERRSQSEPARSSPLRSWRGGVPTHGRGRRQRDFRRDRRPSSPGSIPGRARARSTQGGRRVNEGARISLRDAREDRSVSSPAQPHVTPDRPRSPD